MKTRVIDQSAVRELLLYDRGTGVFTWRERGREWFFADGPHAIWNKRFAGKRAFSPNFQGYYAGSLLSQQVYAHRLAWLFVHGTWPAGMIDHVNGDTSDNRIENLRDVPAAQNQRNLSQQRNNISGQTGVYRHSNGQAWCAQIGDKGKTVHLGSFTDFDDAVAARKDAELRFSYHPNHGRKQEAA
jgi:hypothetical protein